MKFVIFRDQNRFKLATADEWADLEDKYRFKNAEPKRVDMNLSMFNALQSSSASGQIQSYLRELHNGN